MKTNLSTTESCTKRKKNLSSCKREDRKNLPLWQKRSKMEFFTSIFEAFILWRDEKNFFTSFYNPKFYCKYFWETLSSKYFCWRDVLHWFYTNHEIWTIIRSYYLIVTWHFPLQYIFFLKFHSDSKYLKNYILYKQARKPNIFEFTMLL